MKVGFDTLVDRSGNNTAKYTQCQAVFGRDDIIPMWVADMDIISPPFLQEAIQKRAQHPVFGYVDKPEAAIDAQIQWLAHRQKFRVERDWVMSCHSIVTSIHMAIEALCDIGDEVVIMSPVYHEFSKSVEQVKRTLLTWPLSYKNGCYDFCLETLKKRLSPRSKVLILCSPHNPIGRVWTREELELIGNFCIENNMVIIADEMHSDLVYSPHVFTPMATISDAISERCITLQGPGKTFNLTGLGLSSIIIKNAQLRERVYKQYQRYHPSYGTAFSQVAFEVVYRKGGEWLDELLVYLNRNQQELRSMLSAHNSKVAFTASQATFLAWLDCTGLNMDDQNLQRFFVEEAKLGLSPGKQFGAGGEQFMRLNFAVPHDLMRKALEQLDTALSS